VNGVYTGDWIVRACPGCASDRIHRIVRADATALACLACGHNWVRQRMPSDAEATDIIRRSRQSLIEAPFTLAVS
jgi:uncharacterized Zn finger protein